MAGPALVAGPKIQPGPALGEVALPVEHVVSRSWETWPTPWVEEVRVEHAGHGEQRPVVQGGSQPVGQLVQPRITGWFPAPVCSLRDLRLLPVG